MIIYYYSALKIHQSSSFKEMTNYFIIWKNNVEMVKNPLNYFIVSKERCFYSFKETQLKLVENIKQEIKKTQKKLKKLENALLSNTDIAKMPF